MDTSATRDESDQKSVTLSPDALKSFLELAIGSSCEGLMLKLLDNEAHYEIAKRSLNWLKVSQFAYASIQLYFSAHYLITMCTVYS